MIELPNDYVIHADEYQYILAKRIKNKDGEDRFKNISYCETMKWILHNHLGRIKIDGAQSDVVSVARSWMSQCEVLEYQFGMLEQNASSMEIDKELMSVTDNFVVLYDGMSFVCAEKKATAPYYRKPQYFISLKQAMQCAILSEMKIRVRDGKITSLPQWIDEMKVVKKEVSEMNG